VPVASHTRSVCSRVKPSSGLTSLTPSDRSRDQDMAPRPVVPAPLHANHTHSANSARVGWSCIDVHTRSRSAMAPIRTDLADVHLLCNCLLPTQGCRLSAAPDHIEQHSLSTLSSCVSQGNVPTPGFCSHADQLLMPPVSSSCLHRARDIIRTGSTAVTEPQSYEE